MPNMGIAAGSGIGQIRPDNAEVVSSILTSPTQFFEVRTYRDDFSQFLIVVVPWVRALQFKCCSGLSVSSHLAS
jgi:hypothetical protein